MHLQTPQYTTHAPSNTTMHHIHTYVPHLSQEIYLYHQKQLCTMKNSMYHMQQPMHHMHYNTPPNTTYTHMYHMYHNPYMFTTKHHYVPGKFYVPGKILCTTCTTMNHIHYNTPPNTTMHNIHTYVPHGPEYIHVYHKTPLCTRKILCTTCTSKHHMCQHAPPCIAYTYMYHIDHNRYICTTKNTMYKEKLYVPHAPQKTTMHHKTPPCTTKHHQK